MKFKDAFIFLYILTVPLLAMAEPPKWVYRLDYRAPNEIYRDGFQASGNNYDASQHATGSSCVNPNSNTVNMQTAFINTVTNYDALRRAARGMIERDPQHRRMYIYTIRADNNFYPLASTLEEHDRQLNVLTPVSTQQEAMVMGTHIVERRIPVENIMGYRNVYYTDHGVIDAYITYGNGGFVNLETAANTNHYQPGIIANTRRLAASIRNLALPMFSACIVASGLRRDELRNNNEAFSSFLYFFPAEGAMD